MYFFQMDIVLDLADHYALNNLYPESIPADNIWRQLASLLLIVNVGGFFIYMIPATLSYHFLFDKRHLNHPQILQVRYLSSLLFIFTFTLTWLAMHWFVIHVQPQLKILARNCYSSRVTLFLYYRIKCARRYAMLWDLYLWWACQQPLSSCSKSEVTQNFMMMSTLIH